MVEKWIGQAMSTKDVMDNWKNWGWTGLYHWLSPHYDSLSGDQKIALNGLRNVEHFTYIRDPKRYYGSEYWRALKKKLTSGNCCQICQGKEHLHLHHLHYNSIYREDEQSIYVLCSKCHIFVHPFGGMADMKDSEIKRALELLGGKELKKSPGELYDLMVSRTIIEMEQQEAVEKFKLPKDE